MISPLFLAEGSFMHQAKIIFPTVLLVANTAFAEPTWADHQRENLKTTLHQWSNNINSWLGEPDPNRPASAGLRIMLDNEWNRYDGYSIKPRIRGKIKLPVLKQRLNLVFGDDNLDNETKDKNRLVRNYDHLDPNKNYDRKQARESNSSLALRWSQGVKQFGIDTDVDLGLRSGGDIYLRFKANKVWQWTDQFSTRLEQIYRYGINSKHYLRTNFENRFNETENRHFANILYFQYTKDLDELKYWGNSLYRQHNFAGYKRLNYGIFAGGEISKKDFKLMKYGPFINWRQPIYHDWLFIEPELNFYNNRDLNRKHSVGAFMRIEALF